MWLEAAHSDALGQILAGLTACKQAGFEASIDGV